jgi:hypothetical protein|tara:strand:- start:602 stop:973 length:372 start_codon:yes stop_codon:yes gene_type:complete
MNKMTWDFYETGEEFILKEKEVKKELLDTLNPKEKKRIKKILQSAEPTEFFGQDFTKLGELVGELKSLNFIKSDDKLKKKMKGMDERNVDIVASASKLRKEYELLYRQLRDLIYPKGKKGGKK